VQSLLAAEPAADTALGLCSLLLDGLIKLVNGSVEFLAGLLLILLRLGFGIAQGGFGIFALER
jgi:hypothetical protein